MPDATSTPPDRVLAIVVTHDRAGLAVRCVRSLLASEEVDLDVIVVDNGSSDAELAGLRTGIPEVRIIEAGSNGGYAAGLNIGIVSGLDAGYTHFWLLNDDLVISPGALRAALDAARDIPRPGLVVSTQLVTPERPDVPSFDDAVAYPVATIHGRLRSRHFSCDGDCDGPGWHPADVVTGAALLVTAALIRRIGLLDERFFHYSDEEDLAERARTAGYQNLLACRSRVWHRQGATIPMADAQAEYYRLRNLIHLRRRVNGWSLPRLLLHPGYAKAVGRTWLRMRHDERSRIAFRSALRHGLTGRMGRVDMPTDRNGGATPPEVR